MGLIKSFRVGAADNGFTLSYCEEVKTVCSGTYSNTDYKDREKVYTDPKALITDIIELLGKLSKSDGSQAMTIKMEVEDDD